MEHYFDLPADASILEIADARPFETDDEIRMYIYVVTKDGLHLPEAGPGYQRHERALAAIQAHRPDLMP